MLVKPVIHPVIVLKAAKTCIFILAGRYSKVILTAATFSKKLCNLRKAHNNF